MKFSVATVAVTGVSAVHLEATAGANPIRKVVTMLQNVQKKVEAEATKEEQLFKKYMCYCSTSGGDLQKSIDASTAKVPELQGDIEAATAQKAQLGSDLEKHKSDRAAAKTAIGEADAVREKEAAAYAAVKAEATSNIDAINKAVAALEKGAGGAFLQSTKASILRRVMQKTELDDDDRQQVTAFLEQDSSYNPQSGQITGILKAAGDEMSAALAEATKTENEAIASHADLTAAKKKEIAASTEAIEAKTVRVGELGVSIAQMKNDLSDSEAALIEDKKFLADLEKNCKTKQAEWDGIVKVRAEEQVALADTIKILNDDDALELFKKALPGSAASFLDVSASITVKRRALALLHGSKNPQIDFIALALHGKKVGFDKVIKMIDNMVAVLKQDQTDDNDKKENCALQFDSLDDQKKALERGLSDAEAAIDAAKESISTLTSEIESLTNGIKALDKSVAEASEQRKSENAEFTELMAQDTAAKELLGVAKNRLNKFYNPKLYVPEAKLVQISAHGAPPPPPEAPSAYSKKSEESNGVIGMLDKLVQDLDEEMTVAKAEENNAQAAYEQFTEDAAEKRANDSKSIADKTGANADAGAALEKHESNKKATSKELAATLQTISALHGECDWLLKYSDVRAEARSSEIDSLQKAKAVLSGASFAFVQTGSRLRGAPKMEIVGKTEGYRNAWDDCGGAGASATMRMQTIAAKIKGWSPPRKFIRNAAQDADKFDATGEQIGNSDGLVYPAAGVWTNARQGLHKAATTLAKYK